MKVTKDTIRTMSANEPVVVRVQIANPSSGISHRNLLVDSFELVKVPTSQTSNSPHVNIEKAPTVGEDTSEDNQATETTTYNSATGAVIKTMEAENSSYVGKVITDSTASGGLSVKLFSNKKYVEHLFSVPDTDMYSLDFRGYSEDFSGTAHARLVLDSKKLFGDDIVLQAGSKYHYYASERKIRIPEGQHLFRVEFVNDKHGKNAKDDRNLVIDYLRLRGTKRALVSNPPVAVTQTNPGQEVPSSNKQIIEAESASTCKSDKKMVHCDLLAVGDNVAVGEQALMLHKNGDFVEQEFTVDKDGLYTLGATVRSNDYHGSAKANINVDGKRIVSAGIPRSSVYEPLGARVFKFSAGSKHKLKVTFINDLCGYKAEPCNTSNDRNLLVDQLKLTLISQAGINVHATEVAGTNSVNSEQPAWAQSNLDNVIATEWACNPPPASEYGHFQCPKDSKQHIGTMLFRYPANGNRISQAMLYIPKKMIEQYQNHQPVTPLPLVFYLHGKGTVNLNSDGTVSDTPPAERVGWWNNNQESGKLDAAYNTANDPHYGGVIVIAPQGQGQKLTGADWGYPPSIDDFANLPGLIESMLPYLKIDHSRIYTMGSSMGGQDSLAFVALYPELISAAYSNDGVSDWGLRYIQASKRIPSKLDDGHRNVLLAGIPYETGGTPDSNPSAYQSRSPLQSLTKNPGIAQHPIKLEVDMQDSLISPSQSALFYKKLKQLNPNTPSCRTNQNSGHSTGLPQRGKSHPTDPNSPKVYLHAMDFFFNGGNWLTKTSIVQPEKEDACILPDSIN